MAMTRRHVVVGAPAWGVALTFGCARSGAPGDRTGAGTSGAGRSGSEARSGPDARTADAAATVEPDKAPPVPPASRAKRERWPKPATVTATELQLEDLPKMRGITIYDHGQQRVDADRWEIEVLIADPRAAAALRKRGMRIELGDDPTEEDLREDVSSPGSNPARTKRRR
jgi:hypothetical protein